MKILPTNTCEWLRLAAVPFEAFIVFVALAFPYWRFHSPRGFIEDSMTLFALGYFISFIVLVLLAVGQMFVKDRRGAFWSLLFALVAICGGILLIPYYTR